MKSAWRQWQGKVNGAHTGRQTPEPGANELEKQTQAPESHTKELGVGTAFLYLPWIEALCLLSYNLPVP